MNNFEKDLREYSDDELYKKINTVSHQLVHLCSDELTRRSTDRWSKKIVGLTFLLFFIGFLQLFVSLKSVSSSWVQWLFLMILVTYAIFYVVRLIENEKEKPKK